MLPITARRRPRARLRRSYRIALAAVGVTAAGVAGTVVATNLSATAGDESADQARRDHTASIVRTQTAAKASALSTAADAAADAADARVPEAAAALRAAADLAETDLPTARADAAEAASLVVKAFTADATAVLAADSDAEHTAEDALFEAVGALGSAELVDLPDRITTLQQDSAAVQQSAADFRAQLAASTAATNTQPSGGDVAAQLSYLDTYALSYNSAVWGDLNPYGGDCVNFTSQGLLARGWTMDGAWFSDGDPLAASAAWVNSPDLADYFDALGLPYATSADLDRVRAGDVGVFTWDGDGFDHVMTVSKVEYTPDGPKISFVSHNDDGRERDLTETVTVQHPGADYRIYLIP